MSGSDDEFSAFNFSEFTEEDFKQIDAGLEPPNGNPEIVVELEAPPQQPDHTPKSVSRNQPTKKSPYQQYRRGGVLSVTDLASLAWCEVQFDYGLRQRRSRPIATRPKSFVSAQGKEIFVEKSVAVKNDHITKQGKAIHKELEREIRVEELPVDITSNEERWALRLVNMLASLKCMMDDGLTREMPVFGVIHDQVVVGIIDEVAQTPQPLMQSTYTKRSSSHATPESNKRRRTPSPSQQCITDFLPTTPRSQPVESESACEELPATSTPNTSSSQDKSPRYTLQIRDAKTRRRNYLPSHEDTLPSRIQLMLYRRLLKDLISASPAFDFHSLWKQMKLESSKVFSTKFLVQAGLVTESDSFRMVCLDDLAMTWVDMVQQLGTCEVDPNLQLIYRLQPATSKWKRKDKGKGKTPELLHVSQQDRDLSRAIEASLSDQRYGASQNKELDGVSAGPSQMKISSPIKQHSHENPELYGTWPTDGTLPHDQDGSMDVTNVNGTSDLDCELTPDDMPIIGTKTFAYDDAFLNEHVARTLEWWYGHRDPQGVSLKDSRRCFSCEYESSCEWREQKAVELRTNLERD